MIFSISLGEFRDARLEREKLLGRVRFGRQQDLQNTIEIQDNFEFSVCSHPQLTNKPDERLWFVGVAWVV